MTNKNTAGILGIFLGGIGIHKFYTGRFIQGFLYLIFCWTFVPAFVGFCEGVCYFTYSDERWDRDFNGVKVVTNTFSESTRPAETKKCPDCAELVLSEARKCKHCGTVFQSAV